MQQGAVPGRHTRQPRLRSISASTPCGLRVAQRTVALRAVARPLGTAASCRSHVTGQTSSLGSPPRADVRPRHRSIGGYRRSCRRCTWSCCISTIWASSSRRQPHARDENADQERRNANMTRALITTRAGPSIEPRMYRTRRGRPRGSTPGVAPALRRFRRSGMQASSSSPISRTRAELFAVGRPDG
jgi:hypothetical protein